MKILLIITSVFLLSSCCRDPKCKNFTADQLLWDPYQTGKELTFKSAESDSLLHFMVSDHSETQEEGGSCQLAGEYCDNIININITSDENLPILLSYKINSRNFVGGERTKESGKHPSHFSFQIDLALLCDGGLADEEIIPEAKVINGISYTEVINFNYDATSSCVEYPDYVYDTLYFAKGAGIIGFHLYKSNEWYYLK